MPAIGCGEEMKRWAFTVKAKPSAATAFARKDMLVVLNECVRSVVEVVGMLRRAIVDRLAVCVYALEDSK